ncbi:MAG: AAA family ATPase [Phycisphaerae bacterium]
MGLISFSVHGLFGTFDHPIKFDHNQRIKIIHGPNGFGKTSILRLIDAFFNLKYSVLRRIPYTQMVFTFSDNDIIEVQRIQRLVEPKKNAEQGSQSVALKITLRGKNAPPRTYDVKPPMLDRERISLSTIDDIIPELERVGPEEWLHLPTGRRLNLTDAFDEFADQLRQFPGGKMEEPDWLRSVVKSLPVYLIEAQRLLLPSSRGEKLSRLHRLPSPAGMSSAVSVYSRRMVDRIRETLARSAEVSQSLDSSFPERLLHGTTGGNAKIEGVRERYDAQVQKRTRLMEAGLLDRKEEVPLPNGTIGDSEQRVLALYVSDVEKKLAAFDDILKRMELFKEMINRRFQYKQMKIDKNQGFIFETPQGGVVPPSELSSGEQHEVVLANQLLFDVPEGALILIDEPELSLHVAWQQDFLKDLEKISGVIRMDFLIATHSPQIIDGRWDLTSDLQGPKL